MKKFIVGLVLVLFLLAGCGGNNGIPDGMNEDTYNIGVQAVDALESYNDGNMSNDEIKDRLNEYYSQLNVLQFDDDTALDSILNGSVLVQIAAAQNQVLIEETAIDQVRELKELLELN